MLMRVLCFIIFFTATSIACEQENDSGIHAAHFKESPLVEETPELLDHIGNCLIEPTATVSFRLNSSISIAIAGKTMTHKVQIKKDTPVVWEPWESKIALLECKVKETAGQIVIDTEMYGTTRGLHYRSMVCCRLLDADGKLLSEIEKTVHVKTSQGIAKPVVSFVFDTFKQPNHKQFNDVRDYSYPFFSDGSGLKNWIKVYDGMRLGNLPVNPLAVHSIQFELHVGEIVGMCLSTWMYR